MAITEKNGINILDNNNRVFLPSKNINIFPCSRRGQHRDLTTFEYYDPEARLNTERTNRINIAINGFTDSFIVNENFEDGGTLIFALAGYRVEVKSFVPADIAAVLGLVDSDGNLVKSTENIIYAHLSLHTGIPLNGEDYFTEILYRQSTATVQKNYLDVAYTDNGTTDDFFVGISFTKEPVTDGAIDGTPLIPYNLALFELSDGTWQLIQTSLLPKIKHGDTEDSVEISGDFTVKHGEQVSFKITDEETILGPTAISELTVAESAAINGATTVNGTITAKKVVIPSNIDSGGTEKGEVDTPQLRVNRITSNDGNITVDNKKLIVNKSLEMLAKADATDPATATIEKAIIGDLTVKVDSKFKNSTGKVTAKEVVAEKITQNGNTIPTIKLIQNGTAYQLQFTLDASKK